MRALFLILLLLLTSGCFRTPIKVAYVAGTTGTYSAVGIVGRNAVRIAVDEWNKKGGVNGHRIELIISDDKGDPAIGLAEDRRLIAEGAHFIIGHATSNMTPVVDSLIGADLLMVSPTMSSSLLSREDLFVRTIEPTSEQGRALANEMVRQGGHDSILILLDMKNKLYSKDLSDNFRDIIDLQNSDVVWKELSFDEQKADTFAQVVQAVKSGFSTVLIVTTALDFATVAQRLYSENLTPQLLGGRWSSTADVITLGGRAVEGALFATSLQNNKSNASVVFEKEYLTRYGTEPNYLASHAYDAANLLFTAMSELKGSITPLRVRDQIISRGAFEGVQGRFTIDKNGDPAIQSGMAIVRQGALETFGAAH